MLMKICAKCGKKIKRGLRCECWKSRRQERQKLYNSQEQVKERNKFYHSAIWSRLIEIVKARANGLDELSLSQGKLEIGKIVHHIYPVEERPDLKAKLENLIYLSAKNHSRVHKIYNQDEKSKKELQAKLYKIISHRRHQKSGGG